MWTVYGFRSGQLIEGVFAGLDEVGEIEGGAKFGGVEILVQVEAGRAEFAVDVPFVFVDEHRAIRLDVIDFFLQATNHFRASLGEGFVITEDAQEGRVEEFGQFHGEFEPLEMRFERLAEFDFSDGRTDADHTRGRCRRASA